MGSANLPPLTFGRTKWWYSAVVIIPPSNMMWNHGCSHAKKKKRDEGQNPCASADVLVHLHLRPHVSTDSIWFCIHVETWGRCYGFTARMLLQGWGVAEVGVGVLLRNEPSHFSLEKLGWNNYKARRGLIKSWKHWKRIKKQDDGCQLLLVRLRHGDDMWNTSHNFHEDLRFRLANYVWSEECFRDRTLKKSDMFSLYSSALRCVVSHLVFSKRRMVVT